MHLCASFTLRNLQCSGKYPKISGPWIREHRKLRSQHVQVSFCSFPVSTPLLSSSLFSCLPTCLPFSHSPSLSPPTLSFFFSSFLSSFFCASLSFGFPIQSLSHSPVPHSCLYPHFHNINTSSLSIAGCFPFCHAWGCSVFAIVINPPLLLSKPF